MSQMNRFSNQKGFTLVEMLVIAPIALLIITGFIALMVTMVGDVIASRTYNTMTYDIQSALDTIERDVNLSTEFLATSGSLPTPQGKNGATSAFTSTSGDLIMGAIATDKNPLDPTRRFIYYDTPYACDKLADLYKNRIFFTTVAYTVRDGSLWRRTYVPNRNPSFNFCAPVWQVNSCAPGYTASRCDTNDAEVLKNVKDFDVSYYSTPGSTTKLPASSATSASTIRVSIESEQSASGRTITAESSVRATKLTSRQITLSVPDSPYVSGSVSGNVATFSWPAVGGATSYIVTYNINGGEWITATENTQETSFSIPAQRGDTVSAKVLARNTTGSSHDTSSNNASVTIPLWTECSLQNGWVNYLSGYATCGYTMTKHGVVMLKGHIRSGSLTNGVGLFQLPPDFRPQHRLLFQTVISPHSSARVDVDVDGWVRLVSGTSSAYLALDGIYFIPRTSLYSWTNITPQNGWYNYGSPFAPLQTTTDHGGRVHLQGLIRPGTFTDRTVMGQLPAGTAPAQYHHVSARGEFYNLMGIAGNGAIHAKGINSPFVSTQAMFYPASYSGWQNFTTVPWMPADGQIGNGWKWHGGESTTPQYTKSDDGIVTIKGLINGGSTANLTNIAKLPPGYRPEKTVTFSLPSAAGAARVDIGENGWIVVRVASSTWTSLDGISFMADGS